MSLLLVSMPWSFLYEYIVLRIYFFSLILFLLVYFAWPLSYRHVRAPIRVLTQWWLDKHRHRDAKACMCVYVYVYVFVSVCLCVCVPVYYTYIRRALFNLRIPKPLTNLRPIRCYRRRQLHKVPHSGKACVHWIM